MIRVAKIAAVTAVALLLLAMLGVALLLTWPRPAVEYLASHLLDRRVTLGAFSIRWQEPVQIALQDLSIANMPGGSDTAMVAIAGLEASIDRAALLQGKLIYRQLRVERPRIALERDAQGRGNWEFGSNSDDSSNSAEATGRLVLVPKNRRQFPSLLDFRLSHGELRIRTSSGKWLRLPLDDLAIQASDEDAPASIIFDGGYNDTDAQLTATTASFNAFRDATRPFDAAFSIVTPGARLDFKGVIGNPLDFDDVEGRLGLEARRLDDVIAIFDKPVGIAAPLKLAGGFSRAGDAWRLENMAGDIGGNRFEGRFALDEGGRGEADALQIHLDFDRLDLPTVLPKDDGGDWRRITLPPATAPDTAHLDLQVSAQTLLHHGRRLQRVAAAVEVAAGHIRLHGAKASLGDGHLELNGHLAAGSGQKDATLQTAVRLEQADAGALLQLLGLGSDASLLAGNVDGRANLALTGITLGDAMKTARGHAVLAMQQGRIARKLVEAASADLSAIFRSREDDTALRCLLAAATLKDGTLLLAPLVLRSDGGTVRGAGQIELAPQQLEMTLRSDPKTTGLLALDIPLRIHGPLASLSVQPLRGASLPNLPAPALPPEQSALARANPCMQ
ncbi:AsmA-like C-terminal region-containing protein [Ferrovibrio terrae]|uniref:AsmA family protein n=1 Tax=Ferrovibrio terrae TaxID=2594003 RepID=UPI003137DBEE